MELLEELINGGIFMLDLLFGCHSLKPLVTCFGSSVQYSILDNQLFLIYYCSECTMGHFATQKAYIWIEVWKNCRVLP